MFCPSCRHENSSSALHCGKCGMALVASCAACGTELPAAARFCPGCGQPVAGSISAVPLKPAVAAAAVQPQTNERKQVTVLFADFAGFTTFVHKRDAEEVRDFMSSVWARLDDIIAAHGGITEKHIGDAVMAIFGARQAREDDPARAVRAGLAMQAAVSEFQGGGPASLQMRVGIHTGVAVVGPLGATAEFAATGDTVNLANRLEQNAPSGSVLISHDTFRHVYGLFDFQPLAPFAVKGRPEEVQTYVVLRSKARALAVQLREVEGIQTEMIGRDRELGRLQQTLQAVIARGASRILTVIGDPGLGKSCLLNEFQQWAELMPETVRWFYGRATPEMLGLPFSLIRDFFAWRFEIRDSDSPRIAREKLELGISRMLSHNGSNAARKEVAAAGHFIGQLVGLDFSASPWVRDLLNDPEQVRQIALNGLQQFFTAAAERTLPSDRGAPIRGAVLVAEDIHWGDDGSLDVLLQLAGACRSVPLLIVCVARPTLLERRPNWASESSSHELVRLEPLTADSSAALVQSILRKAPSVPQDLLELIISSAEGVPFYIEELIKMFIDQKLIVPGEEQWRIEPARLASTPVPPTLTGVLQARLDGLLPEERNLLQQASVIGRVFWDEAVERLAAGAAEPGPATAEAKVDKSAIVHALDALCRKELVLRRSTSAFSGAGEYMFKHELLRNVAYESLLKKLRRGHHAAVAQWLIEASGERINEFAALVAAHFEQAGSALEAAEWYGRAGEKALEGYSPATAIDYFRKALALLPAHQNSVPAAMARRMEWQQGLAEVLGAQAKFSEAMDACHRARELAGQLGDRLAEARAWNELAYLNERLGRNRTSVECAERAEQLAGEAGEFGVRENIRALLLKGWAHYRLADASAVLALADRTHQLCVEFGNRLGLATSYKLRGVAHLQLGHFGEADRYFEQGLVLYRELGDRRNTAAMWSNLGESARFRGDYARAEQLYQKALEGVREIGHRDSEAIYLTNLSGAQLGLGKFSQAEAELRQAIDVTRGNNFCALSETYSNLSDACIGQNKIEDALAAATRALALARESENDLDLGTSLRALGRALSLADSESGSGAAADMCDAGTSADVRKISGELSNEERSTQNLFGVHPLGCQSERSESTEATRASDSDTLKGGHRTAEGLAAVSSGSGELREGANQDTLKGGHRTGEGLAAVSSGSGGLRESANEDTLKGGHRTGNGAEATPEECFAESLAVFQKIKAEVEQARTLRAWGQHDLRHARIAESRARLIQAGAIFTKLGARSEAAETENLLQAQPR
jgi:class 3 adenylate cyclase/tetratricopeptide (TPR) repeat protein